MSSSQSKQSKPQKPKAGNAKASSSKKQYSDAEYDAYGGTGRNATAPVGHATHVETNEGTRKRPMGETSPPGGLRKKASVERSISKGKRAGGSAVYSSAFDSIPMGEASSKRGMGIQNAVERGTEDIRQTAVQRGSEIVRAPSGGGQRQTPVQRGTEIVRAPSGGGKMKNPVQGEIAKALSQGGGMGVTVQRTSQTTAMNTREIPKIPYDVVLGRFSPHFCHLCTNPVRPQTANVCERCGAIICLGATPGVGCIAYRTLREGERFICHVCIGEKPQGAPPILVSYYMNRTGPRAYAKICWPLLLIPMKLVNLTSLPINMVTHASELEYHFNEEQLFLYEMILKGGSGGSRDMTDKACAFVQKSLESGPPPNMIVILDSHSDPFTGQLQTGAQDQYEDISRLMEKCLSKIQDPMKRASVVARGWEEEVFTLEGRKPWTDMTPRVRGGWRILVALVCGSSMQRDSLRGLSTMVKEGRFDIVVGFTGATTMPFHIYTFVCRLVQVISTVGIAVDDKQNPKPWTTLTQVLLEHQGVLAMHNVLVIYPEQGEKEPVAREVGIHVDGRPFGLHLTRCGAKKCRGRVEDTHVVGVSRYDDMRNRGRIRCTSCGWTSRWVRMDDLDGLVFPLNRMAPSTYYHDYPICAALEAKFLVEAS